MKRIYVLFALVVFSLCAASCGDSALGPQDGALVCADNTDCQDGYRCVEGSCVEKPMCTDFDADGFCDKREGYDDCNDNRADIHPGAEESCDGVDNNCNGEVDEGCPCNSGDTQVCGTDVGACVKGTQTCENGQWGECQGGRQPAAQEDCDDELDNDCDGSINNGCACNEGDSRSCGSDLGQCTPGVQTCQEKDGEWVWSDCTGGTPPVEEICGDDTDNDCDGALDNGCECDEQQRPCGLTAGICSAGVQRCVDGYWGSCEGGRLPDDEVCDGLDNDCDDLTDEGCECLNGEFEACGTDVGECSMGSRHCVHGRWGPCDGEVAPTQELCDGRDNDCDGEYDEDFEELLQPCSAGEGICSRPGAWVCSEDGTSLVCSATPGTGTEEFCNGLDDDCDGSTDEDFQGLGEACSRGEGECYSTGVTVCDPSGGYKCNAPEINPGPELCDGLDNNCDGQVDEVFPLGLSCIVGVGECVATGTWICTADHTGTECDAVALDGTEEQCDGLDNDCDGETDEMLSEPCSTACGDGYKICINGTYGACSARQPTPEVCDGLDNDCDGSTDEDFSNLGNECQAGTGLCLSLGYYVCTLDGSGTECNAVAGNPQLEDINSNRTCEDGVDNDCDGSIDGNDSDCDSGGCRNVSMQDLWSLQFLAGGLGLIMFKRRKKKAAGKAKRGGES